MTWYVLHDPASGNIRAIVRDSLTIAEANLRPGETLLVIESGPVNGRKQCVKDGTLTVKPAEVTSAITQEPLGNLGTIVSEPVKGAGKTK